MLKASVRMRLSVFCPNEFGFEKVVENYLVRILKDINLKLCTVRLDLIFHEFEVFQTLPVECDFGRSWRISLGLES